MQTITGPIRGLRLGLVAAGLAVAGSLAGPVFAQQQGTGGNAGAFDPSDFWLRAYTLLKAGEEAENQGRDLEALNKYIESKPLLDGLSREFPEFYPELVEYRRTFLVQRIGALRDRMRQRGQDGAVPPNLAVNPAPQSSPAPVNPAAFPGPVAVQPVSPEFMPVETVPGAVQLPQWQKPEPGSATTANPAPAPAVVRPPVAGGLAQQNPAAGTPVPADDSPLQRIQRDFDQKKAEIDRLTKRNQELETDLAYRKSELFDAQNALTESQRRAADLQKRLEAAETRAKTDPNLVAQVNELKKVLSDALAELTKVNQEKDGLLAKLTDTQKELERVKGERDAVEKERSQLQAIMAGGGESAATAQLMADNQTLRDKLKQIEESARKLETENRDKTKEIALLKGQIDQIQAERQKLLDDNKRYEGHILELRNRLKELGQDLNEKDLAKVTPRSAEDARESLLLRQIVLKQLSRQTQVMKTKEMVLKELEKLGADAAHVYAMVEDMAAGPKNLTQEEQELFKSPEMIELAEDAGVEELDAAIIVKAGDSAVAAAGGAGVVTQELADELIQIQKSARLDFQEGRYEEAEKAYRQYLTHRPKSVVCLCNLALVKMATKKHAEAQEFLEKAIVLKADSGLPYYLLGRCFFQQGKLDDALKRLDESIHYDPANAKAHNCVGVISSQKGFINRAEGAFSEAVKLDPEFGDAHFNLAVLYATREKPDNYRAAEHYNKAMLLGVPRDTAIETYLETAKGATVSLR